MFLMKLEFQLTHAEDKLWVQVLRAKYHWDVVIPYSLRLQNCSRLWAGLARVWDDVRHRLTWSIRDGRLVDLWFDE
ncbi:hypothetical protein V6N13_026933 [Hibiscus sabdariffa]